VTDFTSALYLDMRHPSTALGAWDALTLGRPAALRAPPGADSLATALAQLAGFESATLLPSTLHLFWDLLWMLAGERITLLVDAACYPIARRTAQHAARSGVPLRPFPHGEAATARRLARAAVQAGRRPVIVADGYFPGADSAPPLRAYAAIARESHGYLVLDDTQPFGLFGVAPSPAAPYGAGGGGSARWHALCGEHVIAGASLAKAFGTPLAVLCASAAVVRRFEMHSETRVHSSPPSVAAIRAGLVALRCNAGHGDVLRERLWQRVRQWRAGMARHGIGCRGGSFPVQTLVLARHVDGARLHRDLAGAGVAAVPQRLGGRSTLSFLITAGHTEAQIDHAVAVLACCLRRQEALDNPRLEAI
jgi:8-amino-7-oxononanoate synthase